MCSTEDKARRVHAKCAALKEQVEQVRDENLSLATETSQLSADLRSEKANARFLQEELDRVKAEAEQQARDHARALKDVQV